MHQMIEDNTLTQYNVAKEMYETIDLSSGEVLATKDHYLVPNNVYLYNHKTFQIFCGLVEGGMEDDEALLKCGIPSRSILKRWLRSDTRINDEYQNAKVGRGDFYREEAIRAANAAAHKDTVPAEKLRVDTFLKIAKADAPKVYGDPKPGNINISTGGGGVTIDTGIRRPGDPGYNRDESLIILQESQYAEEEDPITEAKAKVESEEGEETSGSPLVSVLSGSEEAASAGTEKQEEIQINPDTDL